MTELTEGHVTVADDLINFDTKAFHLLGTANRLGIPGADTGFSTHASHFDMARMVLEESRGYTMVPIHRRKLVSVFQAVVWSLIADRNLEKVNLGQCQRCALGRWDRPRDRPLNPGAQALCESLRGKDWTRFGQYDLKCASKVWLAGRTKDDSFLERLRDWGGNNRSYLYRLACCGGTGGLHATYAELLFWWFNGGDGNPHSQDCIEGHLVVLSDQLQANGDKLGTLLALMMANEVDVAKPIALDLLHDRVLTEVHGNVGHALG
jgi:hypothetical protein